MASVSRGFYGTTIKLEDAFYHIPLYLDLRYIQFILDGTIWQYKSLLMGLTLSPRVLIGNKDDDAIFEKERADCCHIY